MSRWRAGEQLDSDKLNVDPAPQVFGAARSASQAITSGNLPMAANQIAWTLFIEDPWAGWDEGTPQHYTIQEEGWYLLTGGVGFVSSSGGTLRGCGWMLNDALITAGHTRTHVDNSLSATFSTSVLARTLPVLVSVGDTIGLAASQNTGADLDTDTVSENPYIAIYYVGAP